MKPITATAAVLAVLALAPQVQAQETMHAHAAMTDTDGNTVGVVRLAENGNGVLIRADLNGLPPGEHGFHIHETGSCEDGFGAAGGHYNPGGTEHGTLNPNGAHSGDTPNLWVAESGNAVHHVITADVTLAEDGEATLFDDDGSAIVVHENPDSYEADAGAGGRIACGVIEPGEG